MTLTSQTRTHPEVPIKRLILFLFLVVLLPCAAATQSTLANGVYAVLREGPSRGEARVKSPRNTVLVYDAKYSDADKNEPPKYVALDRTFFVPLILDGPPRAQKDGNGFTLLDVTLAREHVKTLERFTAAHLNGKVAIVIGNEIVTLHKVRSVIRDGYARITRCSDDACQTLLLKLAK